jgi:YD repeat-containing protein
LTQAQQVGTTAQQCGNTTSNCAQIRTFVYDSLSRLKQTTNPESGTIFYTYDLNGNLQTKTDALGIKTIHDYDGLNRLIKRCYTIPNPQGSPTTCNELTATTVSLNTLSVTYTYDNLTNAKGKLTKIVTGDVLTPFSVTDYQSFDKFGRVTQSQQTTDGMTSNANYVPMTYKYNLAGALIEQKYPSGRIVKNTLEADADLAQVESAKTQNGSFK